MSATNKIWVNGIAPTCEDVDLNGFKNENNNLIIGSGQTLSTSDNQQTNKAVAHYAGAGDYYVDSGAVNAYILSTTGAQIAPPTYATGMRIRFRAGNANTGASTVNVAGLGVKALVRDDDGSALNAGDISLGETRAYYDGTSFRVTTLALPVASIILQGIVELATVTEAVTGADTSRAVTPEGADALVDDRIAASLSADNEGFLVNRPALVAGTGIFLDFDHNMAGDNFLIGGAIKGSATLAVDFSKVSGTVVNPIGHWVDFGYFGHDGTISPLAGPPATGKIRLHFRNYGSVTQDVTIQAWARRFIT